MDYVILSNRIKEERKRRNLTQEKLSEILGISDAYYGQIERGDRPISLEILIKLTSYYGISVDFFLSGSIADNDTLLTNEWLRLTEGKTVKQKRIILNVVETLAKSLDNNQ